MEIRNKIIIVLISLLSAVSLNAQIINLIICEHGNGISQEIEFEIINSDVERKYDFNKPYIIKSDINKFEIRYRGKTFILNDSKLGIDYRTVYMNFLTNENRSYLIYQIKNGFTVKKELISTNANLCTDEIYLIDNKVTEYIPNERLKNEKCN